MNTGSYLLRKLTLASAIAVGLILMGGQAFASVPISITQQGKLLDEEGTPLSGSVDLDFALYDAETGGTILWSDTLSTSLDDNGVYSVKLGDSSQPIDSELLMDGEVFLSLTVDGEEMSPRLEMTSVPFASLSSAAEVAHSVADGSITSDALASGAVTSESIDSVGWDQITDIPSDVTETSDTLAGLSCSADEVALYNGSEWGCSTFPSYSGSDFALSDQSCSGDNVAAGIDSSGNIVCVSQQDTTYSGSDFALSDQSCSGDDVAVGISTSGNLVCSTPDMVTYTAGTGLDLSGTEFAVDTSYFNANYLQEGGDINVNDIFADGRAELGDRLFVNADGTSTNSHIYFGVNQTTVDGPRIFHNSSNDIFEMRGIEEVHVGRIGNDQVDLEVTGNTNLSGDVTTGGNVNVDGEVTTTGNAEFDGNIRVNSDLSDNISYVRFRDADNSSGPRFFHRESVNRFRLRGADEFNVDMDLSVNGSVSQTSDERLKEDVENLENVLDEVLALQPTRYRMKHWPQERDQKTYGFMAQEVERIFPEAVRYDEDEDQYGLIYSAFSVLAVQAIQEQQELIDDQADRIDELEQRLDRLEAAIH